MVFVHLQIAAARNRQRHTRMVRYLIQHVIEEFKPRIDTALTLAVEIDLDTDIRLRRAARNDGTALRAAQELGHIGPRIGHQHTTQRARFSCQHTLTILGTLQQHRPRTEIIRQLDIRSAVAYNVTRRQIVTAVHIATEHSRTGLARRGIILGHRTVNKFVREYHPLARQCLQHLAVRRPEGLLGKGCRTQTVLIRCQHHVVVQRRKRAQRRDRPRHKLQFLERVDLHILHRLDDDRAVTINEQSFPFHTPQAIPTVFCSLPPILSLCADTLRTPSRGCGCGRLCRRL